MSQLAAATVLITGAGGGFGQALIPQLLAKGSHLILTDHPAAQLSTQVPKLEAAAPELPGKVLACLDMDLAHAAGCDQLYAAIQQMELVPDIVINNAGIALVGNMVDMPTDRWRTMMQVNLLTPMQLSSRFAADMMARRQGHIVNISSLAGWIAPPGLTAYGASKYGLRGFSEGLRYELATYDVKVTTVYPFFSRTPLLQSPRFGSLAESDKALPAALTTDPQKIMAKTIRAIERNQAEVFPDQFAWLGQGIKRYFPFALNWLGQLKV
ncbi:SDR family NAD(P)-dependent oxidoreductase [Leptolyngbya iicbica]|uniref:SDR family NAD(P)-dependent oxidoreductase n=2 Tax=Cyanophyceae TaxID=3028117 RepID=A0A4Q7E6N0_9CYAN|nr:SDR family NAD(P)-dependent oxidoreductase [Leptolyngbya sp. LK]RZM77754.1 SDR family NAD(P)-dependent oxidoreductase [Leptolyngbya sp. LK]